MITSTIEIIKITASENMVLTNGEAYSDVGGSVYLGCNDSAENWYEITAEEYEKIQEELRKLYEDEFVEEDLLDENLTDEDLTEVEEEI